MWESRDELGFPGHGAHGGAGFQEGFACSNRHTDGLAGYSKDFSSAASMTQHVRLLLNIRLFVTEPKWELSSFENPALM